jgi:hypothetical protein
MLDMDTYQAILSTLSQGTTSNKARLKVFACLIIGVIRCRSVNLSKLAALQNSDASEDSQYRKLQRFFLQWVFPWIDIAKITLNRIPKPKGGYILSMDRTNWKFGQTHINILTVGIVVGKVAIPFIWFTLPQSTKRGNSHSKHRILIMKRVFKVLAPEDINFLAMDREFNGKEWLKWLNQKDLAWVLRIKRNTLVNGSHAHLQPLTKRSKNSKKQSIWGMELYFSSKLIENGRTSHLYVVSNKLLPKAALEAYLTRWAIEVLFGHLKKKGFDLESTHLRDRRKIDKLLAVVTLAFLFTLGWGVLLKEQTQHLSARQKRKSIFRLALDALIEMLNKPHRNQQKINMFHDWITSKTQPSIFVV